MGKKNNLEK
ncbi:hypothetical protein CGLO_18184 [Colletotrichum gloeosporioides Cg-14]|uniref:Uncharacterized protein n=1 Tax=Colletotrichum gloeosporioides (strain Cg-14) TaxID=1237896 RepID=T0JV00_COLGC|nr:hypothetical protein CGLO_18184 [Colletotrichum gloeosporioides Cg-14]